MAFWSWSQTSNNNANADSSINWAEGQAPSSVNDSARAMMSVLAKNRDDISGAIVTSGTSTAYTVTSNSGFDTLAHMASQIIAFSPHATNEATVTLNVDSLGAKPLRSAPGVELQAGTIILGTPYVAIYNNTDGAFYLQSVYGNPYNIPLAGGMDYWGGTVPNSAFAFPVGQAISRTTYATLFSIMGTTYGTGDGSATFNLPDKSGRLSAMLEGTPTRLTSTYFGGNSNLLGAVGGGESTTLTLSQLPTGITATGTFSLSDGSLVKTNITTTSFSATGGAQVFSAFPGGAQSIVSPSASGTVTSNNTSGNPHRTVPPVIICNYILRII